MDREMQFDINRRVVLDGLNRRAEERAAVEREATLDAFEDAMIHRINENCDGAIWKRHFADTIRLDREAISARIDKRAENKAKAEQIRKDTRLGVLIFVIYGIVIAWLTKVSHLPVWAAVLYIALGVPFLLLYVCDVHGIFRRGGARNEHCKRHL